MKILGIISAIFLLILISGMVSSAQQKVEQWDRFEASFKYSSKGNGFTDVKFSAVFRGSDTVYNVSGFYDGGNTFKIRFMPQETDYRVFDKDFKKVRLPLKPYIALRITEITN